MPLVIFFYHLSFHLSTTGGGQSLLHFPFQYLTMKGLQQCSDPVAVDYQQLRYALSPIPATVGSYDLTFLSPIVQSYYFLFLSLTSLS